MMQFSLGLVETPLTFHFYSAVKVGDSCNADSLGPQRVSPNCFHWFAWILENWCPKTESWKQLWSQVDWILSFFFANIFQNGGSFFVRRCEIYSKFPWNFLVNFCSGGDAEIPCRAAEGVKRVTLDVFLQHQLLQAKTIKRLNWKANQILERLENLLKIKKTFWQMTSCCWQGTTWWIDSCARSLLAS